MNDTPKSSRLHISLFGRRNSGKSSLINALTNQDIALVSDVPGTTTDPVYKAMEILPVGPVMLIDTAGIDDEGELGELRVKKSLQVLEKTDVALLIADSLSGFSEFDKKVYNLCKSRNITVIIVFNKTDLLDLTTKEDQQRKLTESAKNILGETDATLPPVLFVSSLSKEGILKLKQHLSKV
ncbi:MAG: GTPase, partial [Eubacteriales bacterium]